METLLGFVITGFIAICPPSDLGTACAALRIEVSVEKPMSECSTEVEQIRQAVEKSLSPGNSAVALLTCSAR